MKVAGSSPAGCTRFWAYSEMDITAVFEIASTGSSPVMPTNLCRVDVTEACCFGKTDEKVQFFHTAPSVLFIIFRRDGSTSKALLL